MFIKIYDDQTQNDEYIVNTDNVCCIKYYVLTSGLKDSKQPSSKNYYLEISFTNNNKLTLNFKEPETWNHYIDQFKKLTEDNIKGVDNDRPRKNN